LNGPEIRLLLLRLPSPLRLLLRRRGIVSCLQRPELALAKSITDGSGRACTWNAMSVLEDHAWRCARLGKALGSERARGECIPVDDSADGACNMKMVRARLHHKTGLLARGALLQLLAVQPELPKARGRRAPQIRRDGPPVSGPGLGLRFVVVLLSERHCPY
jgi:hypothetical protein